MGFLIGLVVGGIGVFFALLRFGSKQENKEG